MSTLPSVMVVDDEEELANLFMESLKGSGFDSVSFTDPLLALEHFKSNPEQYSVILSDLKMPGINGIEFAKRISEYDSKVKILLITAFYGVEDLDSSRLKETNISNVLKKPVKIKELIAQVNNLWSKC
ncbi:MAG TPA: response regulator [Candidatus Nitrosocosmicus sp.]|nr:response regulator [Candidatus Nitrosocosmicus sp.]